MFHCSRVKEKGLNVGIIKVLISLLSVVVKICAWILVDRVNRVTGDMIDDEPGDFRAGEGVQIRSSHVECTEILEVWRRCMIGLIGKLCGRCG